MDEVEDLVRQTSTRFVAHGMLIHEGDVLLFRRSGGATKGDVGKFREEPWSPVNSYAKPPSANFLRKPGCTCGLNERSPDERTGIQQDVQYNFSPSPREVKNDP